MKFNLLKKTPTIMSENEKLKFYELQTYKEINNIISKIPKSRRDTFLDRLTGNIFNPNKLTQEEKELLLEKYDNKEYEFILNIKKELEKEAKRKEEIKKRFLQKEDVLVKLESPEEEDIIDDQEEESPEEEEDDWLNKYDDEEVVKEDEDDNIPANNWENNEFFCEKCMKSFEITEDEKNKIDNGEITTIICKNCGKQLQTDTYLEDSEIEEDIDNQDEDIDDQDEESPEEEDNNKNEDV